MPSTVIRAVDGDQRSMRIKVGERSYKCFFQRSSDFEKYREVLTVGGSAKVSGQLYATGLRTSLTRSGVVEVEKLFV